MSYPTKKLWEIAQIINWRAYKRDELLEKGLTPILRVGNLFTRNDWYYSDLKLEDNKYIDNWDLIFAWSASFWPFIWEWNRVIFHYHIWKIICWNLILKEYLFLFLKLETERLKEWWNWVGMIHITKWMMENLDVLLPPLPTQKAIVQKLDEAFARIDASIELAQKNLENVEELGKSVLEGFIKENNFKIHILENILVKKDLWLVRWQKEQWMDKKITYLKMNNISNFNWELLLENTVKVDVNNEELSKYLLEKWDFLFNTRNSFELVWKTALFNLNGEYLFNNNILRFRFVENILPSYINKLFLSNFIKNQLHEMKSWTTNVSAIYYKNLKNLKIPLPPLSKQKEIVEYLDRVFAVNAELKRAYEEKIAHLRELKQSLLREAFEGRLVKE